MPLTREREADLTRWFDDFQAALDELRAALSSGDLDAVALGQVA